MYEAVLKEPAVRRSDHGLTRPWLCKEVRESPGNFRVLIARVATVFGERPLMQDDQPFLMAG